MCYHTAITILSSVTFDNKMLIMNLNAYINIKLHLKYRNIYVRYKTTLILYITLNTKWNAKQKYKQNSKPCTLKHK